MDPDSNVRRRAVHPGALHARECLPEVRQRSIIYTESCDSHPNRVMAALGRCDLARHAANQQEYTGADVVAIGSERPGRVKDFLLGLPAHRLSFTPVMLAATLPSLVVVHPSLPVHNIKELNQYLAFARALPRPPDNRRARHHHDLPDLDRSFPPAICAHRFRVTSRQQMDGRTTRCLTL